MYLAAGEFRSREDNSAFRKNICIYQMNKHLSEHVTCAFACK